MNTPATPNYLSARQIAMQLGRSPKGVRLTISRLGLTPDLVLPVGSYYDREVAGRIGAAMRAPNRRRRNA